MSKIVRTVAPGKQCVVALKNLQCLMMESPTRRAVGAKRGRGGGGEEECGGAGVLGCGVAVVAAVAAAAAR